MKHEVSGGGSSSAAVVGRTVRVLVCDDEDAIRRLYRRALSAGPVEIAEAIDADTCLAEAQRFDPDLVLLDVTLPGRSGLDALSDVRAACPEARIVIISGLVTTATSAAAQTLGADDCVGKVEFLPRIRALIDELVR